MRTYLDITFLFEDNVISLWCLLCLAVRWVHFTLSPNFTGDDALGPHKAKNMLESLLLIWMLRTVPVVTSGWNPGEENGNKFQLSLLQTNQE